MSSQQEVLMYHQLPHTNQVIIIRMRIQSREHKNYDKQQTSMNQPQLMQQKGNLQH